MIEDWMITGKKDRMTTEQRDGMTTEQRDRMTTEQRDGITEQKVGFMSEELKTNTEEMATQGMTSGMIGDMITEEMNTKGALMDHCILIEMLETATLKHILLKQNVMFLETLMI
jgi:hypothetical protein